MARPVKPDVPLPTRGIQMQMNEDVLDELDAAALEIRRKHPKRKHFSRAALVHNLATPANLRALVAKLSEGK